ncbi:polysaccharide deacetylase family protein [Brevibacillus sp. H7]|uniref:polysaccharide deacetylase family protein n=1 Tax=Brevibacillus sp. H7 TaxID=3349138 RepID=UPI00382EBE71
MPRFWLVLTACLSVFATACQPLANQPQQILQRPSASTYSLPDQQLKTSILNRHRSLTPRFWGENVPGVKRRLATKEKVIALTLNACGGPKGDQYDAELMHFLRQQNVPATLFINSRWIDANYWTFMALSRNPLFEIENHGFSHKPLSVNGKQALGIQGTRNPGEAVDEVLKNHRKIQWNTGRQPRFFRSGTAYYDEVAVKIANDLGETVVNYNVLPDSGATFTSEQVKNALLSAKPGSIVLLHMNQPKKETAEGVKKAIPELKRRGFRFVKLQDYPLQ